MCRDVDVSAAAEKVIPRQVCGGIQAHDESTLRVIGIGRTLSEKGAQCPRRLGHEPVVVPEVEDVMEQLLGERGNEFARSLWIALAENKNDLRSHLWRCR